MLGNEVNVLHRKIKKKPSGEVFDQKKQTVLKAQVGQIKNSIIPWGKVGTQRGRKDQKRAWYLQQQNVDKN